MALKTETRKKVHWKPVGLQLNSRLLTSHALWPLLITRFLKIYFYQSMSFNHQTSKWWPPWVTGSQWVLGEWRGSTHPCHVESFLASSTLWVDIFRHNKINKQPQNPRNPLTFFSGPSDLPSFTNPSFPENSQSLLPTFSRLFLSVYNPYLRLSTFLQENTSFPWLWVAASLPQLLPSVSSWGRYLPRERRSHFLIFYDVNCFS